MFLLKRLALTALIGASALAALPVEADARDRHHRHGYYGHRDNDRYRDYRRYDRRDYRRDYRRSHYRDRNYYCRRGSGTTGLIVGGAAGALLGREVDRYGDRLPGTIIGGAAGALIGREVDRGGRRC